MKKFTGYMIHICLILLFVSQGWAERSVDIDDVIFPEGYEITNLGAAVTQIATLNGYLADNIHYIFSRNTIPGMHPADQWSGAIWSLPFPKTKSDASTRKHLRTKFL